MMDIETVGLHMLEKELTAVNSKIQMKLGFYNSNSKHIHTCITFERIPNSNQILNPLKIRTVSV